ncbi:MAG TPA: glutamate racemase [Candidatus Wujingus californicus]|uniref:glutamate racemase n=1 Tax=Candidatus Wujingus californicus TaxID=3367618 RepID=UPI004029637B
MKSQKNRLPIGVFDSGVGGISVLVEIIKLLPHEEFIYYADSINAPYGTKPENTIRSLTIKASDFLFKLGVKSLVVACNTATSVAIKEIRRIFELPVIGMEPAIKPAVELKTNSRIIVMATPLTLQSKKFNSFVYQYKHLAEIIPIPCPGLVELIERGNNNIADYLYNILLPETNKNISTVVLGCTHYVLIKREILKVLGKNINVIDGNCGTARHLKTVLEKEGLLNNTLEDKLQIPLRANVRFYTSGTGKEVLKYKQLLQVEGITCES